jgi:hypothetical protein
LEIVALPFGIFLGKVEQLLLGECLLVQTRHVVGEGGRACGCRELDRELDRAPPLRPKSLRRGVDEMIISPSALCCAVYNTIPGISMLILTKLGF